MKSLLMFLTMSSIFLVGCSGEKEEVEDVGTTQNTVQEDGKGTTDLDTGDKDID